MLAKDCVDWKIQEGQGARVWSLDQGIKSLDIELHRILIPSLLRFFCQSSLYQGHERLLPRQEESDFPLCERRWREWRESKEMWCNLVRKKSIEERSYVNHNQFSFLLRHLSNKEAKKREFPSRLSPLKNERRIKASRMSFLERIKKRVIWIVNKIE